METKTKDNVFVNLVVVVQYRVLPDKVYEAFYMLHDPEQQIKAFIFDLVRAQVPLLNLDDVYEAFYMLHDPEQQIKAFIFDLVRAQVPLLNLDDVFSKKDDIAIAVKK